MIWWAYSGHLVIGEILQVLRTKRCIFLREVLRRYESEGRRNLLRKRDVLPEESHAHDLVAVVCKLESLLWWYFSRNQSMVMIKCNRILSVQKETASTLIIVFEEKY